MCQFAAMKSLSGIQCNYNAVANSGLILCAPNQQIVILLLRNVRSNFASGKMK